MSRRKDTRAHLIYTRPHVIQSRPPLVASVRALSRELHMLLDTALSLACHTLLECGWLRVVRDQSTREGATVLTHTQAFGPHDTDSTFLGHAPRSEHVYGRAREACLYAATQPFGHFGSEPKSSCRRWRALTETGLRQ